MKNSKTSLKPKMDIKRSIRTSGYITLVSIIAIAVTVLVNLIVSQLPTSITQFDISSSKIYTVTDTSKEYLSTLDEDVEFILFEENGVADERVLKFINNYVSLSDHLSFSEIDPAVNPSALDEYGAEASSLLVRNTSTGKQTTISLTDMFSYDETYLYYYGQYYETGFDAEGQITSAVDYVSSENNYVVYTMSGHGETALPTAATDAIDKANISTSVVNLLENGSVPEDCTVLVSNAPTSDLSDDELTMLQEFMESGGQVTLIYPSSDTTYNNWQTLLNSYGLNMVDGYIGDTLNYYANAQSYFAFFPTLSSTSSITSSLATDAMALVLNTRAMEQIETDSNVTVDAFMTTSESGFIDGDSDNTGIFILGAVSSDETSRLIVFSSAYLLDENLLTSFPNLANIDIFINALTDGLTDVSNISIAEKSLETSYNTVTNPQIWGIFFVIVIPLLTIGGGLCFWIRRKRR